MNDLKVGDKVRFLALLEGSIDYKVTTIQHIDKENNKTLLEVDGWVFNADIDNLEKYE